MTTRWTAWHLHLSALGAPATDQLVRHAVGPAVDWCRERQPRASWFFVRYWQYGPHVRVRFGGLDSGARLRLERLLQERVAELAATVPALLTPDEYRRQAAPMAAAGEGAGPLDLGELSTPGVYRRPYRPEVERYGGRSLLPESESLFEAASELALAFVRRNPPEAARAGLGLRATGAALDVVAEGRRHQFCRQAAGHWQAWAAQGGMRKSLAVPPPAPLGGQLPAPLRQWSDRLAPAMARWRAQLTEAGAEQVLRSHIHMLHNRLGLTIGQERNHYLALAPTGVPPRLDATAAVGS